MKTFKKIFGIIITLAIIAWVGIIVYDLFIFKDEKQMKFCLKEQTKTYDYGTTYECVGLGYKAYRYDWPNTADGHYKASDFVPFFINERTPSNINK